MTSQTRQDDNSSESGVHPQYTMLPLLLLVLSFLHPLLLAGDGVDVPHGHVECGDQFCYLTCDGGWVNKGSYRIPVEEDDWQGLACVEPATLVIAGYSTKPDTDTSGRIDSLEVYANRSLVEHNIPNLPLTRSYHTATTVGSTVYLTGGQINDYDDEGDVIRGVYTKTCLKWNFETDQWIYTADLSFARWWHSAAEWQNYIFVFGGRDDSAGTVVDSIEKFDVDTEEWSHGPVGTCTTPVPMYGQCSVRLGEKIYLVGGLNSKTNYLASTFSFSPASGQWTVEQNLQQARVHHACASLGGGILVAGGSISGRYLDSAEWWNPATQTWQWAGQMMVPREYHSLSVSLNTATVLGGFYISGFTNHYLDSLEVYTPGQNSSSWGLADQHLVTARRRFAVAQLPAHLFV